MIRVYTSAQPPDPQKPAEEEGTQDVEEIDPSQQEQEQDDQEEDDDDDDDDDDPEEQEEEQIKLAKQLSLQEMHASQAGMEAQRLLLKPFKSWGGVTVGVERADTIERRTKPDH